MPKLNPAMKRRMQAEIERIQLNEKLRAAWDSVCDNCREPLEGDRWARETSFGDPDDPEVSSTYFCPKCISISKDRRKFARGAPSA